MTRLQPGSPTHMASVCYIKYDQFVYQQKHIQVNDKKKDDNYQKKN